MLGKALHLNGAQTATSFKDVSAASKASGYIQSAVDRDIINGMKMAHFRPLIPLPVSKCLIFW